MTSRQARDRALRRGPGLFGFLLAHHWPGQLDRCYLVWLGDKPVWFCARCSGLYPAMISVLVLQLLFGVRESVYDWLWLFGLPLPAAVDWSLSRLRIVRGSNHARTLTGVFLGAGLGRTVYLNMIEPFNTLVVVQLAALAGMVLLVEVTAKVMGSIRRSNGDGK